MKRVDFGEMRCSIARALDRMGDWWTPLIVRDVYLGVNRFDDMVENLGISRNLLTTRLRGLVESGILTRTPYQERPVRHEYALTEAGRDLVPVITALMTWGSKWAQPKEGAPMLLTHKTCGHVMHATVCCSECGEGLKPEEISVQPGPGAAMLPGTIVLAQRFVAARVRKPPAD